MIQWFPGHMAKTRRLINENIKLVDVVLELVDARLPLSSRNPLISEILGEKPSVLILNKADMAEEEYTQKWLACFRKDGISALPFNSILKTGRSDKKRLLESVRAKAGKELDRRKAKGIKDMVVRLMILGIPNVGKSTLINYLSGRGSAETGDKPGVTRGKQWIRLEENIELLDMPGILWPKFDDPLIGMKLAVTGAIKEEVYDSLELSVWLLNWLINNRPGMVGERYKVEEIGEPLVVMERICKKRGFIIRGGQLDMEKGANILLAEFRGGKLGKITLDDIVS
jgi:ribosome biogenesis GTPase A